MGHDAKEPVAAHLAERPAANRVRYLYIYGFVFENPRWFANLGYGFLCHLSAQIVPILGQMVFLGYMFEITESLVRQPGRAYPDFELGKFSYYLQRSVPPFLVSLIFLVPGMLLAAVACGLELAGTVAVMSMSRQDTAAWVLLGGMLLVSITFLSVLTVAFIPATPFFIRSGLAQDLAQGLKLKWSLDFLKRVWFELLMFNIFNLVTLLPMILLGYSCCVVGVFAVLSLDTFASASTYCQLYNLYLARGGEPIPFKVPRVTVAPAN